MQIIELTSTHLPVTVHGTNGPEIKFVPRPADFMDTLFNKSLHLSFGLMGGGFLGHFLNLPSEKEAGAAKSSNQQNWHHLFMVGGIFLAALSVFGRTVNEYRHTQNFYSEYDRQKALIS